MVVLMTLCSWWTFWCWGARQGVSPRLAVIDPSVNLLFNSYVFKMLPYVDMWIHTVTCRCVYWTNSGFKMSIRDKPGDVLCHLNELALWPSCFLEFLWSGKNLVYLLKCVYLFTVWALCNETTKEIMDEVQWDLCSKAHGALGTV